MERRQPSAAGRSGIIWLAGKMGNEIEKKKTELSSHHGTHTTHTAITIHATTRSSRPLARNTLRHCRDQRIHPLRKDEEKKPCYIYSLVNIRLLFWFIAWLSRCLKVGHFDNQVDIFSPTSFWPRRQAHNWHLLTLIGRQKRMTICN